MEYEVPIVLKEDVTILAIGDSLEATTIRSLLESLNYRVTVHWIGSRKEFIEVAKGNITTDDCIIISCHGIDKGMYFPDEKPLDAHELSTVAKLDGKCVINLGCLTGTPSFVNAFKNIGVRHYIAPVDYPEGSATMLFVANLFYLLSKKSTLDDAVTKASGFDDETKQFKLLV